MPAGVRKCKPDSKGRDWCIINKDTGKIEGRSTSKAKAQASANARNAARHGWKPTGKKARK